MEDGPEAAEGTYTYGTKSYRLEERESEVWTVMGDDQVLGTVRALPEAGDRGVLYEVHAPGDAEAEDVTTTDWKAALEYVIDHSA